MTARTQQASVTAYYLGRPAALWRTAMSSRRTSHKSPRSSLAGRSQEPAPEQHIR